jgi:Ca2+/Na+ antiporter
MQVRDILVYTFAVAFMLYALDSGHITGKYVAMCFLAYLLYVLAVMTADFHCRGWIPYQPVRQVAAMLSPRAHKRRRHPPCTKVKMAGLTPTSPSCKSCKLHSFRSPRSPRGPRGPRSPRLGTTSKVQKTLNSSLKTPAYVMFKAPMGTLDEYFGQVTARQDAQGNGAQPEAAISAAYMDTVLTLPVSHMCGDANGSDTVAVRSFTSLSIEQTRAMPLPSKPNLSSLWLLTMEYVIAIASGFSAPLRLMQDWTVPCEREQIPALGEKVESRPKIMWKIVIQLLLAFQVLALYFRVHLTLHSWLVATGIWAAVIAVGVVVAAACVTLSCTKTIPRHRARRSCNPDIQMTSLEILKFPVRGDSVDCTGVQPTQKELPDKEPSSNAVKPASAAPGNSSVLQAAQEDRISSGSLDSIPGYRLQAPAPSQQSLCNTISTCLDGLSFLTSIFWIQLLAEELVAMLDFLGKVLNLDHTLLGLTLLAWGEIPPYIPVH